MRIAGGRKTEEDIRKETRDRVKKHRAAKKKLPRQTPKPELSVTEPHVTESKTDTEKPKVSKPRWVEDAEQSSRWLAEFAFACRTYLPRITVEADREEARRLVAELLGEPKAEAA
jgi:hypothetical protein